MPAIDSIANFQTTVGSTFAAGVMAPGDSATVRNFPITAQAVIADVFYDDVTSPQPWRVRSPLLHDNVRGLSFYPGSSSPSRLFPFDLNQPLEPQDTLIFELSTAATTGKALGGLIIFYPQLPGASARLYNYGDIKGLVQNIKVLEVDIGSGANTAGTWLDTVLTTSENLLHANTDYAVLGASLDVAVAAVGIKGIDTGNLRIVAPGGTNNPFGPEYFVRLAERTGLPCIPVINSANVAGTFVSIISSAATAAASHATVYLAELAQNLS